MNTSTIIGLSELTDEYIRLNTAIKELNLDYNKIFRICKILDIEILQYKSKFRTKYFIRQDNIPKIKKYIQELESEPKINKLTNKEIETRIKEAKELKEKLCGLDISEII